MYVQIFWKQFQITNTRVTPLHVLRASPLPISTLLLTETLHTGSTKTMYS